MNPIPLNLAAEDYLTEIVLRKMLEAATPGYAIGQCYVRGGFGYLRRTIRGFNNAAKGTPFLVLTDLDRAECPPALIGEWLPVPMSPNLLFRVAVRQVEAWVMADRAAFARFLGIRRQLVPTDVDGLDHAKRRLIELASASRHRELRRDIAPPAGSNRWQGPDYNGRLGVFVRNRWDPRRAALVSPSLRRTLDRLDNFAPAW